MDIKELIDTIAENWKKIDTFYERGNTLAADALERANFTLQQRLDKLQQSGKYKLIIE